MLWSWAARSAISEPKPKSLQVSLMVRWGSSASRATSEDEAEASSKSTSSEREEKAQAQSCSVRFKQLDLGPPKGGCHNLIFLHARLLLPRLHYLIVNSSHEGKYL